MKQKILRSGFTTGSAAAATKAALILLISGRIPKDVEVHIPEGKTLNIPVYRCTMNGDSAECTVIKDAGDDPDITNGAVIGSRVSLTPTLPFDVGGVRIKS